MALKKPREAPLGAAREFGLRVGLRKTPPQGKLSRCHAIRCPRQGLECAPWRGVQQRDASRDGLQKVNANEWHWKVRSRFGGRRRTRIRALCRTL